MNLRQLSLYVAVKEDEMEQAYKLYRIKKIDMKFFLKYMEMLYNETYEVIRFTKMYLKEDELKCDKLRDRLKTTYYYYIDKM